MIVLIDNYDSFTYNIVHYLGELGVICHVHRNDKITVKDIFSLKPEAIVLSPGPCTPNEAGICCDLIESAADKIPLLGVCLGHQAIGHVFGGHVVRAPSLMHGKISKITHNSQGIFHNLPKQFEATRYHSLTVDEDNLPDCLDITARSNDGLIMGLQHKRYSLHGVQFHPESIASEYGHLIFENFLNIANVKRSKTKRDAAEKTIQQKSTRKSVTTRQSLQKNS